MTKELLDALETFEALVFFTQELEGRNQEYLAAVRAQSDNISHTDQSRLLSTVLLEIEALRERFDIIAPDEDFRKLYRDARTQPGYSYLPKLYIDRYLCRGFERVFARWPHVPAHALVIYDGKTDRSLKQIFTLEGALFRDVTFLLERASEIQKGVEDFRTRSTDDQFALLSYSRAAVTMTFHFLEAYLNGLAYDCFMLHHDGLALDDHDLLAEWNSRKKRQKYVSFETKLFAYPRLVAKTYGLTLDVSGLPSAKLLAEEGKKIRDALVHPSPYVDARTGHHEKIYWVTGTGFEAARQLVDAAKTYVLAVEQGVGKDPSKTMPWFLP